VTYRGGAQTANFAVTTTGTGNIEFYPSSTFSRTTGILSSAGKLVISGGSSTLDTGTGTISATDVELSASGNITFAAPTTASNKVSVEALGSATTALNANITAGSGGILVKSAGRITSNSGTSAAVPRLFGTAGGPITLWTTTSSGGVALGNFNQLSAIQSSAGGADITIGGGDESSAGSNRPAGNATSTTGHGIQLGARSSGYVANDFVVRAGTGHFSTKGAYTGSTSGSFSGIEMRPGFDILAGTVTLNGETSSTNSTASQAGIDI
jgi:hypothetical protein